MTTDREAAIRENLHVRYQGDIAALKSELSDAHERAKRLDELATSYFEEKMKLEAELAACREQARTDVKMLMTELADARASASDALDLAHSLRERLEEKDAEIEDIQSALERIGRWLLKDVPPGEPPTEAHKLREIARAALAAAGGQE